MFPELEKIANAWIDAMNAHDAAKLADLYAPNATHISPNLRQQQPKTNGIIKGSGAIRAWEESAFRAMPSLQYELRQVTPDKATGRIWLDYIRKVEGQPDRYVAEVLLVRADGKIIGSHVYNG